MLAAEVARHDRAIVLGDFNAVPDAPELAPMWALAADTDPDCAPRPPVPPRSRTTATAGTAGAARAAVR